MYIHLRGRVVVCHGYPIWRFTMNLLGRAGDPAFWSGEVREKEHFANFRQQCLNYWEKQDLEHKRFGVLNYSDFKLFWTTGDRKIYEAQYFERRTAMEHTVPLALIYPEEQKYMDKVMDLVYLMCDEYTWCLPAHQGKLEENYVSKLDLFASETGFTLSLVYHLFGERLEPLIRNRILYELERRVKNEFLSVENYGWWEQGHTNWTAVCMGSVACTFMLMYPELVDEKLLARFNKAMDGYLSGFKDDGVCLEGCGYWAYGMGFFVMYADMVRTFTEGRVDYFKIPKVKAIATFPQKMFLSGAASVSFADGGRSLHYNMCLLHRLKAEYPDDVLIYSPDLGTYSNGCGRTQYMIFGAAWQSEEYYNNPADDTACFEFHATDSQWYVKRTETYGFAAKAGCNAEMHNHNDVGSFIFAKGGKQLLMDVGSGTYTRQYFGPERYTITECASFGHSVPLFGKNYQGAGAKFASTDVVYGDGSFSMEMKGAYALSELKSLKRSFTCYDTYVTMVDEIDYEGKEDVIERIVSLIKPEIVDTGMAQIENATISYDASVCTAEVVEVEGYGIRRAPIYAIDFKLNPGVTRFEITIK